MKAVTFSTVKQINGISTEIALKLSHEPEKKFPYFSELLINGKCPEVDMEGIYIDATTSSQEELVKSTAAKHDMIIYLCKSLNISDTEAKSIMSELVQDVVVDEKADEETNEEHNTEREAPKIDDVKEIIISVEHEVKGVKHKISFTTKLCDDGYWNTTMGVDQTKFPAVKHMYPLYKIDEERDKEHFLAKMANVIGTTQKACQSIMYRVSDEAGKSEDFKVSEDVLQQIRDIINRQKQEEIDKAMKEAEKAAAEKGKFTLRGCFTPENYSISTGEGAPACGITFYHYVKKNGEPSALVVCNCMCMITGIFDSCDTKSKMVEVQFTTPNTTSGGYRWQKEVVPISAIRTKHGVIKELIPKGLSVEERSINDLISYFSACIASNYDVKDSAFKCYGISERPGWKDEKCTRYNLGNLTMCDKKSEKEKPYVAQTVFPDEEQAKKLQLTGTLDGWMDAVRGIAHIPRMRGLMYDSLSSMLLRPMKVSPHTTMLIYPTTEGKTTVMQGCASMYGNPDDLGGGLLYGGNITIPAAAAILGMHTDMSTFIDETTGAPDAIRKLFPYMVGNAQPPTRSKVDGNLRDRNLIMTNAMCSAEKSMLADCIDDGAYLRCVLIYDRIIPANSEKIVDQAKFGVKENYGHIAPLFIIKFFEMRDQLPDIFEKAKARLVKTALNDKTKRQANTYALMEVAGVILEKVFEEHWFKDPMNPSEVVDEMWKNYVLNCPEESMGVKSLRMFHSWFMNQFNTHGLLYDAVTEWCTNKKGELYEQQLKKGDICIWEEGLYIDFLRAEFDKHLRANGFTNTDGVYASWRDELGVLEYEIDKDENGNEKKRTRFTTRHHKSVESDGKDPVHVVRIIKDKMYEVLGLKRTIDEKKDKPQNAIHVDGVGEIILNYNFKPPETISDEESDRLYKEYMLDV